MRGRRGFRAALWVFFLLAALFSGFMEAKAFAQVKIRYAEQPFYTAGFRYSYALKMGILKAEGFDVEVRQMFPLTIDKAMIAGDLDCAVMRLTDYALLREKGIALKAVTTMISSRANGIFVRADSNIRTIADLKGKKFGIPSMAGPEAITYRAVLEHKHGIKSNEIQWVGKEMPVLGQLVLKGDIDAGVQYGGLYFVAKRNPKLRLLADTHALWPEVSGEWPIIGVLVCQQSVLNRHPNLDTSLLAAFLKSKEYGEAHLDETVKAYVQQFNAREASEREGAPHGTILLSLGNDEKRRILKFVDFMIEQGIQKKRFTIEELFTDAHERLARGK
ncbi:MAG: ABC transporter substrate-binding protein [Candidatus Tectomicrobia bacterium]|nr:ABC transporter substrate-binding protein [Candidatus Tectomicrobia bacterium]